MAVSSRRLEREPWTNATKLVRPDGLDTHRHAPLRGEPSANTAKVTQRPEAEGEARQAHLPDRCRNEELSTVASAVEPGRPAPEAAAQAPPAPTASERLMALGASLQKCREALSVKGIGDITKEKQGEESPPSS